MRSEITYLFGWAVVFLARDSEGVIGVKLFLQKGLSSSGH